ncbi:phage terminase large subunit [uncultured Pseudosulfitobacter sp.]|uniref:phage terminase large subunit n=1 Tax=uncultured Pseudosulfitobacter sp. TaxID=2854214 RepID=UPI0030D943E4|tara:strand:- start:9438 stop:11333 length:1896 start_codon:yes stop_codon:yes gene_type:complete
MTETTEIKTNRPEPLFKGRTSTGKLVSLALVPKYEALNAKIREENAALPEGEPKKPLHDTTVDPLADFRRFLYLIWKHLNLPQPTRVQYDMANVLQKMAYGNDEVGVRIIIQAFRGVGKSWVTSAFVLWLLYMNPQLNVLVISASKMRADEFTTFTLRLIKEVPFLAHLIPDRHQRQSAVAFDVAPAKASHAPSVKSLGINGQLAGSRADIIVPDDIEVQNNSATQGMRDKLSESVKEFDAILKPGGRIAYLGTPQTEMSIYNALATRGYRTFIWPARFPDEKRLRSYGEKIAKFILKLMGKGAEVGTTTDPQRFSDFDLAERELSYGRSGFALQFMLDTSLSDAEKYPLRLSDLSVIDCDADKAPQNVIWSRAPENKLELPAVGFAGDAFHRPQRIEGDWLPYTGAVMSIDPSGRGKDETSWAVVKNLNSLLYLTEMGGVMGGYSEENLTALAQTAKDQKVNLILIESNFGDGMFTELFKPFLKKIGYQVAIEEVRHNTQKEQRIIDTLEPVMNQHRLIVDRGVVEYDFKSTSSLPPEDQLKYQLFYQLTRITKDRGAIVHDDRLDAVAMAVAYWVDQMGTIAAEAVDERREEMLQQEVTNMLDLAKAGLAAFLGGVPGGNRKGNWLGRK